jgi:hypothetical protein
MQIGWSGTINWMIRFPRKQQQQLLVAGVSNMHQWMDPLPMVKQSPTQRKFQRRCQQSRTRFWRRRQRLGQEMGPVHGGHQTGPSGFFSFRIEEALKFYCTQDGSSTSLVSTRPHTQQEEEDLADEGAKDEGRNSQEGERCALQ